MGRRTVPVLALVLLTACVSPAASHSSLEPVAASPSVTAGTPTATQAATASPTTVPMPAPGSDALTPDTIGEVLVTDLVVRSAPGVGADSEILKRRLTLGDTVYAIEGPVAANGYAWFLVAQVAELAEVPARGWMAAASREGEPWVRRTEPPCPDEISVDSLASVAEPLRLYCFGGQELTLDGEIQPFCAHSDPVIQSPPWLANYGCSFSAPDRPDAVSDWPAIAVRFDPERLGGSPPFTGPAQIVGRYDALVAQTCHYGESAQNQFLTELDELLLVFDCRASFVVELATPLGP